MQRSFRSFAFEERKRTFGYVRTTESEATTRFEAETNLWRFLEAGDGIEPTNRGFAGPCITTLLPSQSEDWQVYNCDYIIIKF